MVPEFDGWRATFVFTLGAGIATIPTTFAACGAATVLVAVGVLPDGSLPALLWVLFGLIAAAAAAVGVAFVRLDRRYEVEDFRRRTRRCVRCGYGLRQLSVANRQCPECGKTFRRPDVPAFRAD